MAEPKWLQNMNSDEYLKEDFDAKGKSKYTIEGIDKNDPDYGVYLFKRGFNGHVIEYIGDFYLPISPYYYILQIRKKLKK